jgi:hypothetical protein
MSDTPRTDAEFSDDYYTSGFVRTEFAQQLEHELAAAIASFSEERERAQREGERVIAAIEQRDKALVAIKAAQDLLSTWIVPDSRISDHQVLNDLLGVLDNKDLVLFLKECGK